MSAKEMFEKLGYKQLGSFKPDDDYIIIAYHKEEYNDDYYVYFYGDKSIRILMETKRKDIYPPIVNFDTYKAINKQVEELGWYER